VQSECSTGQGVERLSKGLSEELPADCDTVFAVLHGDEGSTLELQCSGKAPMKRKKTSLAIMLLLLTIGLGITLIISLPGRDKETIKLDNTQGEDLAGIKAIEKADVGQNSDQSTTSSDKVETKEGKDTGKEIDRSNPSQFIRIINEKHENIEGTRLFLIPTEHAITFLPAFIDFRRSLDLMESMGMDLFEHSIFRDKRPVELLRNNEGLYPLPEIAFSGFTAIAVSKGYCAVVFSPVRKSDCVSLIELDRKGMVTLGGGGATDEKSVYIEVEDLNSKFASSRFFLVHIEEKDGGRFSLRPGRYKFRSWTYEHESNEHESDEDESDEDGDVDMNPTRIHLSETQEVHAVASGEDTPVTFKYIPCVLSQESEEITVRLMYEGKNVTPKEIFELSQGKGDDPLVGKCCEPCVKICSGEDGGGIQDHDFYRFDRVKTIDFELDKDNLYTLVFDAYSMYVRIMRWGIYPKGQTIDLNLSRNDFPMGAGTLRIAVESSAPDDEIQTFVYRKSIMGFTAEGSAYGKEVKFNKLEPGRYKVLSFKRGEYQLFQPQMKDVELNNDIVEISLDLNNLFGMNLTIKDNSDIASDSSVRPHYRLYFAERSTGEIGKDLMGVRQAKIGGFRKGEYSVSVGVRTGGGFYQSKPVSVKLGTGVPDVIVELTKGGRKVNPRISGKVGYETSYEVRFYNEQNHLFISFDYFEIEGCGCVVLPLGIYRIEFIGKDNDSKGDSAIIDTINDAEEQWAVWSREEGEVKIFTNLREYRKHIYGNEHEEEDE
jgi:hypothetical protein